MPVRWARYSVAHDESAATLLMQRVLSFLDKIE